MEVNLSMEKHLEKRDVAKGKEYEDTQWL